MVSISSRFAPRSPPTAPICLSGTLYGDTKDFSLQANSQLTSAAQFSQLVVAYRDGVPLRLNQVANCLQQFQQRQEHVLDQRPAEHHPRGTETAGRQYCRSRRSGQSRHPLSARLHAAWSLLRKGRRRRRPGPRLHRRGQPHSRHHDLSRRAGHLCISRHGIFDHHCQRDDSRFDPWLIRRHAAARLFRRHVFDDGDHPLGRLHRRRCHRHDREHRASSRDGQDAIAGRARWRERGRLHDHLDDHFPGRRLSAHRLSQRSAGPPASRIRGHDLRIDTALRPHRAHADSHAMQPLSQLARRRRQLVPSSGRNASTPRCRKPIGVHWMWSCGISARPSSPVSR